MSPGSVGRTPEASDEGRHAVTDQTASTLSVSAHSPSAEATVVVAVGDVDLASADYLRGRLLAAIEHGTTVLDLGAVEFCDSSGLRVIMEMDRKARAGGASFRLAAPTEPVARLFGLTKAHEVLEVFPDVEAALRG